MRGLSNNSTFNPILYLSDNSFKGNWTIIYKETCLNKSCVMLLTFPLHCIKSELYLAQWKWILRSGPKLKMLVKFHRSNGSFPNLLNWWRIRFGCTALDQCYWNKENWFANWKSTMHFSLPPQHKRDKQFCAHRVSDSYPVFFLLIATTSNKNF